MANQQVDLNSIRSREPIEFLRQEFVRLKARNPAFSLRAYARRLGISPARLSEVLNRKRTLTKGQVDKIAVAFALDPDTAATFARRSRPQTQGVKKSDVAKYSDLDLETFRLMADWHHSAILCLLETSPKPPAMSIKWMAQRLGISTIECNRAIERLVKLKLVKREGKAFKPTARNLATSSGIPSAALRHLHRQMLDLARSALETQSIEDRDVTSITMAIDKTRLPEAKVMIKDFRRKLCAFLEGGDASEVYSLNVQLFQLSK
jgi:uncharacterized protein (TIGR02147 family)